MTRLVLVAIVAFANLSGSIDAQSRDAPPRHDLPQPYQTTRNWGELPAGMKWAAVTAVEVSPDGNSIYVVHRCFDNSCTGRREPPILKYDRHGKLVKTWGEGMFNFPHGATVDRDGNLWVTDARGAEGKGHQVFKFNPDGKVLMTLGKAGVSGSGADLFDQPTDVVIAPDGDIFVTDSHRNGRNNRVVKFDRSGKYIKEWGKKGSGPGEISEPHTIAMDSRGRLFVGDRENNRIQIFDQDGHLLEQWHQFGRPSGISITRDDTIYVTDSESGPDTGAHESTTIRKGIRIGSARDGSVTAFIEESEWQVADHSGAEGIGVDTEGNVYGAVVRRQMLERHVKPNNAPPNPYQSINGWAQFPDGRKWGATAGIEIDRDGKTVWAIDRCGANTCVGSNLDPILKFDTAGRLLKSFGKGMFAFPHGMHVDAEGNVWITDMVLQDGRGQGAKGIGQQVIKFSPDGRELMRLGKAGVTGNGPDTFSAPSDVVVGASGDIFVSDGHGEGTTERIVKFDRRGKFIKQWGKAGTGRPGTGEFSSLHALAIDSRGRLFIGDRDNNRIQIYTQDGQFLDSWTQFGRPSGIYIDRADNIYVADSESDTGPDDNKNNGGWKRGIRVGSAKDGSVKAFIPDPNPVSRTTSAAEGVAADRDGIIYGAEVQQRNVMRYVKKP